MSCERRYAVCKCQSCRANEVADLRSECAEPVRRGFETSPTRSLMYVVVDRAFRLVAAVAVVAALWFIVSEFG